MEYKLSLPTDAALDAAGLDRTIAFARESGLSPEVAQKALAFANSEVASDRTAREAALLAAWTPKDPAKPDATGGAEWERCNTEYKALSLADPELGNGNQHTLDATVRRAQQAFDAFATPEFTGLLHSIAANSHPEVLRVFARIGKAMGESGAVASGAATPTPRVPGQLKYPNTTFPQQG